MQAPTEFVDEAFATFEHGLSERGHAFRNAQLATVSPEGRPGLRTVILRAFDRTPPTLEFHSDARAAKVRDIGHASHVALLAWSAGDRLQLRFEGTATLHRADDLARTRWDALSETARAPYGLRATPGHAVATPDGLDHLPPTERFQQFTVVRIALTSADILRLGDAGRQTRATTRFDQATWLAP